MSLAFNRVVYAKLSAYYFFYFALLGAVLPYLSLYFQSLNFTDIQIGQLMAVLMATKVISPNLIGWMADKTASPIKWVKISSFLAWGIGAGLVIFDHFWTVFWVVFGFSFFWHAALPQYETFTFKVLGDEHKHRYGHIRLWGSVGFIVAVMAVGELVQLAGIVVLPSLLVAVLGVVWLTSLWVKDETEPMVTKAVSPAFWPILKQPVVIGLLLVSFLMQLSHGTYYGFYSILLEGHHYTKTDIAWLWSLGVMAEIAIFVGALPLLRRYSIRGLMLVSLGLTVLRWGLIPLFVDNGVILIFAQLLHAASFGLFHATAIHLVDDYFRGSHQGKGQALFAASSHGLGGALGLLIAGYTWQAGGAYLSFGFSGGVVLLAFMVAYFHVDPLRGR